MELTEWLNTQKNLMNNKYDTTTMAISNRGISDKQKVKT